MNNSNFQNAKVEFVAKIVDLMKDAIYSYDSPFLQTKLPHNRAQQMFLKKVLKQKKLLKRVNALTFVEFQALHIFINNILESGDIADEAIAFVVGWICKDLDAEDISFVEEQLELTPSAEIFQKVLLFQDVVSKESKQIKLLEREKNQLILENKNIKASFEKKTTIAPENNKESEKLIALTKENQDQDAKITNLKGKVIRLEKYYSSLLEKKDQEISSLRAEINKEKLKNFQKSNQEKTLTKSPTEPCTDKDISKNNAEDILEFTKQELKKASLDDSYLELFEDFNIALVSGHGGAVKRDLKIIGTTTTLLTNRSDKDAKKGSISKFDFIFGDGAHGHNVEELAKKYGRNYKSLDSNGNRSKQIIRALVYELTN